LSYLSWEKSNISVTVAMESAGMYWISLFQILEERGFKVYLVNAGRKSDVSDCEWIQYLHSVGLLKASFRPPEDICAVRTLWRQPRQPAPDGRRTHAAHTEVSQPDEPADLVLVSSLLRTQIDRPLWRGLHYLVFPCAVLLFLHSILTDPNLKDGHPELLDEGKVFIEISLLISVAATTILSACAGEDFVTSECDCELLGQIPSTSLR
jgi:hypothetical protein